MPKLGQRERSLGNVGKLSRVSGGGGGEGGGCRSETRARHRCCRLRLGSRCVSWNLEERAVCPRMEKGSEKWNWMGSVCWVGSSSGRSVLAELGKAWNAGFQQRSPHEAAWLPVVFRGNTPGILEVPHSSVRTWHTPSCDQSCVSLGPGEGWVLFYDPF